MFDPKKKTKKKEKKKHTQKKNTENLTFSMNYFEMIMRWVIVAASKKNEQIGNIIFFGNCFL